MERVALHLATGLDPDRWRPVIVCLSVRGDFADIAEQNGVEVLALGKMPGKDLRLPFRLSRLLRRRGVGVIHAHNSGPWFSGTLAGLIGELGPVVVTDHSRKYPERARVRFVEWALSHFVTVVSVSEDNKRQMVDNLGIAPDRIHVIPNGVAPSPAPANGVVERLRAEFGIEPGQFVFVCVARIEAQKAMEVLIEAARIARSAGYDGRVLIVGIGSQMEQAKTLARAAGVAETCLFAGKRLDVGDFYALADAFVLSSHWEGLPMSVLEAMSAGLPVVSTRVGDIPEVVHEGENGFLAPAGDPRSLAEAMMRLYRAGAARNGMSAASRRIFCDGYSVETMVARYDRLYGELL
ncbi:glycosyltransferase family 4 protein [bacterium]|nr:glycosyltransferase family 4 protein [bacterium]